MRFTPLIVAGFAGLATAQRMSDAVPDCAVECLEDGIQSATDCALDDGDCVCEVDNYRNTYDVIQACVLLACGAARSLGMFSIYPALSPVPALPCEVLSLLL